MKMNKLEEIVKKHPELKDVLIWINPPKNKDMFAGSKSSRWKINYYFNLALTKDGMSESTAKMFTAAIPGYLELNEVIDNRSDIDRRAFKQTLSAEAKKIMDETRLHRENIARVCQMIDFLCEMTDFELPGDGKLAEIKSDIYSAVESVTEGVYPPYVEWGLKKRRAFARRVVKFTRAVSIAYVKSKILKEVIS